MTTHYKKKRANIAANPHLQGKRITGRFTKNLQYKGN